MRVRAGEPRGRAGLAGTRHGQALVEFALGSMVLALLTMGLVDFARAYYYDVGIHGAAYSGARHGAWFDFGYRQNKYLDDADILSAVNQGLSGSGLATVSSIVGTCDSGFGTNGVLHNPPYAASYYPTAQNTALVYVCYTKAGSSTSVGTVSAAPTAYDYTWRGGDVNVVVLMN